MGERLGWIGLGKIGAPMAQTLLNKGHDLTVWNRNASRSAPLREAGARVATDVAELARASDVVFVSVADDAALRAVALGEGGALAHMPAGGVLIETSTVSPGVSAEVAQSADARGIAYLRAPVSGSVALAAAGGLTVLASGPRRTFDAVQPFLGAFSARQVYAGDGDQARVMKLAINVMVGLTAAMMGEAMALCLKNGMDRKTVLDVMGASAIASPLVQYKIEALRARDYSPKFEVTQMAKDFDLALQAGHASDTPMPLAAHVREGWSALRASGDGGEDFFKYVELVLRSAGVTEG